MRKSAVGVCVCVWGVGCNCTDLCMSECLSNFYGDYLIKKRIKWTGVPETFQPCPPGATTYKTVRAERRLPAEMIISKEKNAVYTQTTSCCVMVLLDRYLLSKDTLK